MRPRFFAATLLMCATCLAGNTYAYTTDLISGINPDYPNALLYIPDSYNPEIPAPLLMALHGYAGSGTQVEQYMQFLTRIEEFGYLYVIPSGRVDPGYKRFWAATDHCCDLWGISGPDDDVIFLSAVLDWIRESYNVAPRQIFVVGHSNGGMMAHRLGCDLPGVVASFVSLAGTGYYDENLCKPTEPVHMVQIHGTADQTVLYNGGVFPPPLNTAYPGAEETVEDWVDLNACEVTVDQLLSIDLASSVPGAETERYRYVSGCNFGGSAELWKMVNGRHDSPLTEEFRTNVLDFFFAHPNHRLNFESSSTITWDKVQVVRPPHRYNMYRGELSDLVDNNEDGLPDSIPAYGDCVNSVDPNLHDEVFEEIDTPLVGDGYFYLVNCTYHGVEGGIGKTGNGEPQQRPIDVPCP
jgi:polyhydroxybutyrate depolymerase